MQQDVISPTTGRCYGHATVLKFCRDAARRAGLSATAEAAELLVKTVRQYLAIFVFVTTVEDKPSVT